MRLLVARSTSSASSVIAGKVVSGHLCTSSFVLSLGKQCAILCLQLTGYCVQVSTDTLCNLLHCLHVVTKGHCFWFFCPLPDPITLCSFACYASPFHLSLCALFTVLLSTVTLWNCWLRLILAVISFQARLLILKHQKALYSYWNGASLKGINRGRF